MTGLGSRAHLGICTDIGTVSAGSRVDTRCIAGLEFDKRQWLLTLICIYEIIFMIKHDDIYSFMIWSYAINLAMMCAPGVVKHSLALSVQGVAYLGMCHIFARICVYLWDYLKQTYDCKMLVWRKDFKISYLSVNTKLFIVQL